MSVTHPLLPMVSATLYATTDGRVRGEGVTIDLREALTGALGPLLARLMWSTPTVSVDQVASLIDHQVVSGWAELLGGNPAGMVITKVKNDALRALVFNEKWGAMVASVVQEISLYSKISVIDGEVTLSRTKTMLDDLDIAADVLTEERFAYQADWNPKGREHDALTVNEGCGDLWEAVFDDLLVLLRACTEIVKAAQLVQYGLPLAPHTAALVLWAGLRFGDSAYVIGESRGGPVLDLVRAREYRASGMSAREARALEFGDPAGVPTLEALLVLGALTA